MLFDLRGRRRRAVQVTYASLAILMGLGLIGFGIGSDAAGGLADIFTGDDGADVSDANKETQKRIDSANDKLKANPKDQAALIQLVRGHYTIAAGEASSEDGTFSDKGKDELKKASDAWKRYLALKPEKVDPDVAVLMMQAYSPAALNLPAEGATAAEIVAEQRGDPSSYVQLVQFASLAGQKRKADLAAEKALEVAAPEERKAVKDAIEQAKASAAQPPEGGGAQPPAPGGG